MKSSGRSCRHVPRAYEGLVGSCRVRYGYLRRRLPTDGGSSITFHPQVRQRTRRHAQPSPSPSRKPKSRESTRLEDTPKHVVRVSVTLGIAGIDRPAAATAPRRKGRETPSGIHHKKQRVPKASRSKTPYLACLKKNLASFTAPCKNPRVLLRASIHPTSLIPGPDSVSTLPTIPRATALHSTLQAPHDPLPPVHRVMRHPPCPVPPLPAPPHQRPPLPCLPSNEPTYPAKTTTQTFPPSLPPETTTPHYKTTTKPHRPTEPATMPSAKFNEVYAKTREIKSGPSNDDLLNVRFSSPLSVHLFFPLSSPLLSCPHIPPPIRRPWEIEEK